MKLYYDKRLSDPTYYAQQGFRNGKKTTTRNVKNFGKHSELLKITDDPLSCSRFYIRATSDNLWCVRARRKQEYFRKLKARSQATVQPWKAECSQSLWI